MKPFAESDFLVTFTGEAPSARLIRGWDRVISYLDYSATNREPDESYADPNNTGLHDPDNWTHLSCGAGEDHGDSRFEFQEDIGECCHVTITRITEDINEEWVDAKTEDRLIDLLVQIGDLKRKLQQGAAA